MAYKYHIDELNIYKFILDQFNNNSTNGKISFSIGNTFLRDDDSIGFVRRFTYQDGRFDVKRTLSDDTYEVTNQSIVPMFIDSLNSNYLAYDTIKEITYQPIIGILAYAESDVVLDVILETIKEIRAKLIQYETTFTATYTNLDNKDGAKITEVMKAICMSSEINYGQLETIAGKRYLSVTMELTMEVTNYGDYANQEKTYLSVPSVGGGAFYEVYPLAWHWGTGIDTEDAQLLTDRSVTYSSFSNMIRGIPKSTAFSFTMRLYIDLSSSSLISRKLFKDSRIPTKTNTQEVWTLKDEIYVYNTETETFVVDSEFTINDKFNVVTKALPKDVSKGDRFELVLAFTPRIPIEAV